MAQAIYKFKKVIDSGERFLNSFHTGVQQLSHATWYDRYPNIFEEIKANFDLQKDLMILSFGCSKGEETASLNKYFPGKKIIGADVSSRILKIAEKRCEEFLNICFVNISKDSLRNYGPFDIIFAMSVLCKMNKTDKANHISQIYPFQIFEETCNMFYQNLKKEGILVIYNSNYRFTDTSISEKFTPLLLHKVIDSGFVIKFDKKGNRLTNQTYEYCAFRKNL